MRTFTFNKKWSDTDLAELRKFDERQKNVSAKLKKFAHALTTHEALVELFHDVKPYEYSTISRIAKGIVKAEIYEKATQEVDQFISQFSLYGQIGTEKAKFRARLEEKYSPERLALLPATKSLHELVRELRVDSALDLKGIEISQEQLLSLSDQLTAHTDQLRQQMAELQAEIDDDEKDRMILEEKRVWYQKQSIRVKEQRELEDRIHEMESL